MRKAVSDAIVIAWLQALRSTRPRSGVLLAVLLVPLPFLFLARYLLPEGVEAGPRLIARSIVFTVGMSTANSLAVWLNNDRFTYRLALIRAYPVHQVSYAAGMVLTATVRALLSAGLLLLFAPVFGIDIHLSPWLLPVAALTAVSLSGVALVISTRSPNLETATMLTSVAGFTILLMSPIYFPVSRLPDWLQPLARLSPYTYSADALDGILSGRHDFLGDVGVLAAITVVSLCIGVAGMRWREV